MKSWKKQLNNEFEAAAPALSDNVRNAPIITEEYLSEDVRSGNALAKRRFGIWASCVAAALLAIVIAFLGIFGVFSPTNAITDKFVFSLEINPAVSFITDKDGTVRSVNALNSDADVILSDETTLQNLKNVPLSEAVVTYADCAARLGYLDVTATQSAVRLSSSTETDKALLESTSESLRSYFRSNGIYAAVVEDVVTATELSERLGVAGKQTLAELTSSLENMSVRFGERIEADAGEEYLQSLYETYIVGAQMLEVVRGELLKNVGAIMENAQMLAQIGRLNYTIMLNKDNPLSPLPADYWAVKDYADKDYGYEFAALMSNMNGLLAAYENKFGVAIGSLAELTEAEEAYSSLSDIDFEELFSTLDADGFRQSVKEYVGMLKNVGCDVAELEGLLSAPKTAQEYFKQMDKSLKQLSETRKESYKEAYEQSRDEISEDEYTKFIKDLEKENGSLKDFWDNKKNK